MWVEVRDLECFGRPTRLKIWKRRWRCRELLCSARTWTEPLKFLDAQVVLTRRTGAEACRRVGELARPGQAQARQGRWRNGLRRIPGGFRGRIRSRRGNGNRLGRVMVVGKLWPFFKLPGIRRSLAVAPGLSRRCFGEAGSLGAFRRGFAARDCRGYNSRFLG